MRKNGQIVSIDLAASVLVFALMLAFLYNAWSTTSSRWQEQRQSIDLEEKAVQQAGLLVEYPGYPSTWNAGNAEIVGLAVHPNVLSPEKIAFFSQMDYNDLREKMNIQNYNFQVEILSEDHLLDQNIGVAPGFDSKIAVVEHRILIGENNAVFRFKLFQ